MRIRFSGNQVEIQTPAKVNIFLELHGRRGDGFHQLETIISSVSLFDTVRLQPRRDSQIKIKIRPSVTRSTRSSERPIPVDESNLVYQAIDSVRGHVRSSSNGQRKLCGVDVWIDKRIPVEAGLGGASSNAAGALVGVNRLWNCGSEFTNRNLFC